MSTISNAEAIAGWSVMSIEAVEAPVELFEPIREEAHRQAR